MAAAVAIIWKGEIATIRTFSSANGNEYLYYMEYKADYDLDDVIEHNVASNRDLMAYIIGRIGKGLPISISSTKLSAENKQEVFNCTSFQTRNALNDSWLYGRNYDFNKNPTLVTVSHPKNGYASIATSDMPHFGFSIDKIPDSFMSKVNCLAAIYAPMDGINEKGLCTSIMAISNHLLSPKFYTEVPDKSVGNVSSLSWWRYENVNNYLQEHDNRITLHDAQVCLYHVFWKDLLCDDGFLEDTQYSNVYDQSALQLYLRNWNDYPHTYIFSLK